MFRSVSLGWAFCPVWLLFLYSPQARLSRSLEILHRAWENLREGRISLSWTVAYKSHSVVGWCGSVVAAQHNVEFLALQPAARVQLLEGLLDDLRAHVLSVSTVSIRIHFGGVMLWFGFG